MNRVQIFTRPSLIAPASTIDNSLPKTFEQVFLNLYKGLVQEHNTMTMAELVFNLKSGTRYARDTITNCPLQFSSKTKMLLHEIRDTLYT